MKDGTYINHAGMFIQQHDAEGYYVGVGSVYAGVNMNTVDKLTAVIPDGVRYGVWTDPDTGIFYIDYTDHILDLPVAQRVAAANTELVIWDCKNKANLWL